MNNLQQQFREQQFSNEYQLVNGVVMHAGSRHTSQMMAKAAVAVYEAAVENNRPEK